MKLDPDAAIVTNSPAPKADSNGFFGGGVEISRSTKYREFTGVSACGES